MEGEAEQSEQATTTNEESSVEQTSPEQSIQEVSSDTESSETQQEGTETSQEQVSTGLIVDDSETDLSEGQMKKTDFLQKLREEICSTIGPVLATVGQTTDGCVLI